VNHSWQTRWRRVLLLAGVLWSLPIISEGNEQRRRSAEIQSAFQRYKEVAYGYGHCSATQMDCSCFVQKVLRGKFGLAIPRSTLSQTDWFSQYRVQAIRRSSELNDANLCIGDLIYTYRGSSWEGGSRHVMIYVGSDAIVHSSWPHGVRWEGLDVARRNRLYGVYRPLGCTAPEVSEPVRPRSLPRRSSRVHPSLNGTISVDTAASGVAVRSVIDSLFLAWTDRDLRLYRRMWSPHAVQWVGGERHGFQEIIERRREKFDKLMRVKHRYEITGIRVLGNFAMVDLVYSVHRTYSDHQESGDHVRESYILLKTDGRWLITQNEVDQAG